MLPEEILLSRISLDFRELSDISLREIEKNMF